MKNTVQAYGVGGVGEELKDESLIQCTWITHTFLCVWIPVPAGKEVIQELSGGWRKEMGTASLPFAESWLFSYISSFL